MYKRINFHPNPLTPIDCPIEITKTTLSFWSLPPYTFVEAERVADPIDQAVQCQQTFIGETLDAFRISQAQKVAHAQERKQRGLGPICEDCGNLIPTERLTAMPYTTRCIQCQMKLERRTTCTTYSH
jgi:RNA polymerase-binding transcription factor DksA